jgi:ribonuclease P protein subunit POP4
MSIKPSNLLRHELIGLDVKVEKSTSRSLTGLGGKVVDESYNTLTIEVAKKPRKRKVKTKRKSKKSKPRLVEKVIPKSSSIFIFKLPNGVKVQVVGRALVGRPEDRIKKRIRRW